MLKIITTGAGNDILREDLTGIKTDPDDLKEYHSELIRLCKEKHGVGVSANQLGIRENFFFVMPGARFPNRRAASKPTFNICANPTWEPGKGSQVATAAEGCLSIPGRNFDVGRHTVIEAEWDNVMGARQKRTLKGFAARVFQHEHDHLRGITLLESGEEVEEGGGE